MRARLGLPEWTATPNPHAPDPDAGPEGGAGKPDDDKGGEWKPPATADELNRIVEQRLARERGKYGATPEQVAEYKAKAEQLTALEAASRTDQERAVEEARVAARAETLKEAAPRLVAAEFRAAAAGKLTGDQLTGLLEDLDLAKYLNDKGDVDVERVTKRVASLATVPERPFPDLGGGKRGGAAKTTDMNAAIRQAAGFSGA